MRNRPGNDVKLALFSFKGEWVGSTASNSDYTIACRTATVPVATATDPDGNTSERVVNQCESATVFRLASLSVSITQSDTRN